MSIIVAVLSLIANLFLAVIYHSLREVSWAKLEDALEEKGTPERWGRIRKSHYRMIISVAALRCVFMVVFQVSLICGLILSRGSWSDQGFVLPGGTLAGIAVEAGVIAVGILVVFGVVAAYSWALYTAESVIVWCYPLIVTVDGLCRPLTYILAPVDPLVKRLSGVGNTATQDQREQQEEELLNAVEEKADIFDEEEKEMIASVLDFRDTTADEIMTPRTDVVGIAVDSRPEDFMRIVNEKGYSRYPVYEESIDNVIGILYAKDLLLDFNRPLKGDVIRQRLRKPYFVPESKTVRDLLHDFQNRKVHVAVVLDEYGGTAGIVTIEDILEELVGEIEDEHEMPKNEPVKRIDENTIDIDARYDVEDFNEEFNLDIPEDDDYETVGGFVFATLGHIPVLGESFEYKNLRITITDAQQRCINRLRVEIVRPSSDDSSETKSQDAI